MITENAWPRISAAYYNREVIQVDVKGVRTYSLDGRDVPCIQVQHGNVTGIIPAHETGVRGVPETADEIISLPFAEKREISRCIGSRLVGLPVWILIYGLEVKEKRFLASRKRALEIMAPRAWQRIEVGAVLPGTVRELYPKRAVLDLGGKRARRLQDHGGDYISVIFMSCMWFFGHRRSCLTGPNSPPADWERG
jgi:ribosomal protein S1